MKRQEIEQLAKRISIDRTAIDQQRILSAAEAALEDAHKSGTSPVRISFRSRFTLLVGAGGLAAALLVVTSWLALGLSREVSALKDELAQARREVPVAQADSPDDSATINLYLKEHQDVVARRASLDSAPPPVQMQVSRDDILYYEFLDDGLGYMGPGIIVRGPSPRRNISPSEAPAISNGHTLTLSEARRTSNFDLVAPPRLYPGYRLEKIRRIEDRDALHLLYSDGINRISLFEQHLDAERRLEPRDFREYAVYCNEGQSGGTILAWRSDELSYVLVGNAELSQLMDMAQSSSAGR